MLYFVAEDSLDECADSSHIYSMLSNCSSNHGVAMPPSPQMESGSSKHSPFVTPPVSANDVTLSSVVSNKSASYIEFYLDSSSDNCDLQRHGDAIAALASKYSFTKYQRW